MKKTLRFLTLSALVAVISTSASAQTNSYLDETTNGKEAPSSIDTSIKSLIETDSWNLCTTLLAKLRNSNHYVTASLASAFLIYYLCIQIANANLADTATYPDTFDANFEAIQDMVDFIQNQTAATFTTINTCIQTNETAENLNNSLAELTSNYSLYDDFFCSQGAQHIPAWIASKIGMCE